MNLVRITQLKKEPQKWKSNKKSRKKLKPKKFIVNKNRVYKIIEKCHYGKAGHVKGPLSTLNKEELHNKAQLIRRMGQEVCLSQQLAAVPDSGIHSCTFYSQIAKKGRYKGQRVICLNFSCTPSGYIMDETCLNFRLK